MNLSEYSKVVNALKLIKNVYANFFLKKPMLSLYVFGSNKGSTQLEKSGNFITMGKSVARSGYVLKYVLNVAVPRYLEYG